MTTYGYARVSSDGQSLEAQEEALRGAGADRIFAEKQSGTKLTVPLWPAVRTP
jgi:DNA invertase Pin-like site-specific DNA recombinase